MPTPKSLRPPTPDKARLRRFVLRAFGLLVLCAGGCGTLTPSAVQEPFAILERQRLEAGNGVRWMKQHEDPDSAAYQKARDAYAEWIAQVESDLYYGHKLGEDTYNESLTEPVARAYDFIHYAGGLGRKLEDPRADHVNPAAANMAAAALLRIWNIHRISPKNQKDEIVKHFETLKWPSFEKAV